MKGFVTWIGIGTSTAVSIVQAVQTGDPIVAAKTATICVIVLGVARKIEKVIKALGR